MKAPQQQQQRNPMMRQKPKREGIKENKAWGGVKKCYDTDRAFFKVKENF